jgi:hypothetical protein
MHIQHSNIGHMLPSEMCIKSIVLIGEIHILQMLHLLFAVLDLTCNRILHALEKEKLAFGQLAQYRPLSNRQLPGHVHR